MDEAMVKRITNLAIAAGMVFVAYKFGPNQAVKAMALGVGGVIAARQIPFVKDYV
jgi:hypothetical protein